MNKPQFSLTLLTVIMLTQSPLGFADVSTDRLGELTQASAAAQQAQQGVIQYQQQTKEQFQENQKALAPVTLIGPALPGTAPTQVTTTPPYTAPSAVGITTPPAGQQPQAPDTITGYSTPPGQDNKSNAQPWDYNY